MGKTKDEKRARKAAKAARAEEGAAPLALAASGPPVPMPPAATELPVGSTEVVSASMVLTKADRKRLRLLAIERRTSFRRLMHQAWNHFLASQGLPGLTPVYVSDLKRKVDWHDD